MDNDRKICTEILPEGKRSLYTQRWSLNNLVIKVWIYKSDIVIFIIEKTVVASRISVRKKRITKLLSLSKPDSVQIARKFCDKMISDITNNDGRECLRIME